MFEIAARTFKGGKFLFLDVGFPRQDRLLRVDVKIGEPRLGRGDQAIGNQRAVIAGKMANDRFAAAFFDHGNCIPF